jgi:hypothetical protein
VDISEEYALKQISMGRSSNFQVLYLVTLKYPRLLRGRGVVRLLSERWPLFSDWSSRASTHWKRWRKSSINWFICFRIIPRFGSLGFTILQASNIDDH